MECEEVRVPVTGDAEESAAFDAAIRARLESLADGKLKAELLAAGHTIAYLDGDVIVRESPDGTCTVVGRLGGLPDGPNDR